ncbi:MAG: HAMP domain-containing protein [Treponema sp.]|nr:HAMP domain-containing protein [Treponema sp.]
MKIKKVFLKYPSLFYGIICLFANILAVASTNITSFPMPDNKPMQAWKAFLDSKPVLINSLSILCYMLPVLLCVSYVRKAVKHQNDEKEFIKYQVHIPAAFALRGTAGWISNCILEMAFLIYFKFYFDMDITFILIMSLSSYIFLSILSFTLTYFTLETLNRNVVLPNLYPEGNISDTERMSLSSIRNIFLFYFFSAAIFPAGFLGIRLFFTKRYNVEIPDYNDFIFAGIILFIGFLMTILMSHFFSGPLKKLTNSANEISKGNYDCKTVICSNDEMGVLGDTFNDMTKALKEKEFMRDTFGKIVTPQIRDYLLNKNVALGGESLDVTVMFCDIRGFTSLSENMAPEKIVSFLNKYFTGLEKCIARHNGVINKYIGDAVMALFGAPMQSESHASDAYAAACDMRNELVKMNQEFKAEGLPEIRFGIGLHSGTVLAGNIGAENRMEYTVIGDTVNTASRIEGLCKLYKKDLLLSESTAQRLKEKNPALQLTFVEESEIRGRKEKVKLYSDSLSDL